MSNYKIFIRPEALYELKNSPAYIRHRLKQAIDNIKNDPFSGKIKQLKVDDVTETAFRLRLENWRIIYLVSKNESCIDILAIRKRPPYDYGDLSELISKVY